MSKGKSILQETIRIVIPLAILAGGIGGFVVFGRKPEIPQRDTSDDGIADVKTSPARSFTKKITFEEEGVAVPYRTLKVSAEVAGRITDKADSAKSGRFVTEGETLFQIDVTDYKLEQERLKAQKKQTDQEIAAVEVDIRNTKRLIEVAKQQLALKKKDLARHEQALREGSINQSAVDEAELQMLNADNALKTLENQSAALTQKIETLNATKNLTDVQLKKADADFRRTTIKSPASGTVIIDNVEKHDFVNRGDVLLRINDTGSAEVKCNLRVEVIYWIWLQSGLYAPDTSIERSKRLQMPTTDVNVVFEFQGIEYEWQGKLSRYEGTGLDEKTRTIPCRILISDPARVKATWKSKERRKAPVPLVPPTLFSGLYVKVRIPVASPQPLIEIPPAGLRPGEKVWVVRDGKLAILKVDVARATTNRVLIRRTSPAGLQPGDKVVVSPLAGVKNGMPAREANTP